MAGLFQVKELEAKKRALAAESEVFRQTLKLEFQNLRLSTVQMRRRFTASPLVKLAPLAGVLLATPFGGMLFRRRRSGWSRLVSGALVGWRVYKGMAPTLRGLFKRTNAEEPAREQARAGRI